MSLHNQFDVRRSTVSNLLCGLSPLIVIGFHIHVMKQPVLWRVSVCPCPSKIVLFAMWALVLWLFIGTYWMLINWCSLETCLQHFLRWANVQADLNMLTQMLTKKHYPSHMKHISDGLPWSISYETYFG
jgi:hypothetical protein